MDLKEVKNLAREYHFWPSRRLGQNFLVDEKVLKKIIETADLDKNDLVLEVGPGIGNLTRELAKRAKEVIAIEKDQRMVEILEKLLESSNVQNVQIVKGDILKINLKPYTLNLKPYKVVANIPYYLTSPLIRKFLETKNQPKEMILMVQKEVAQRICARPPDMSLLAVSVQFYAEPKVISFVSKKSFWPQPKVDSAIIRISKIKNRVSIYGNEGEEENEVLFAHQKSKIFSNLFFKIVRAGFSQPRKQLINNLSRLRPAFTKVSAGKQGYGGQAKELKMDKPRSRTSSLQGKEKVKNWLLKNGIKPTQRAETLTLGDWISLTKGLPPPPINRWGVKLDY